MSLPRNFVALLVPAALIACAHAEPGPRFAPEAIQAHMRFLADDLLEGREAGTRGYDLAAGYVATQFQLLGLDPAGDAGGYTQAVPLHAAWSVPEKMGFVVKGEKELVLAYGDDVVISDIPGEPTTDVEAEAVFVGFGIQAPELEHDDYAGLDVEGKVVVVLTGFPKRFPSEPGAYFSSSVNKRATAAARGAVGAVFVYTPTFEKVAPWARVKRAKDDMSMAWLDGQGVPHDLTPGIRVRALVSPERGGALFEGAPRSYEEVRQESVEGAPRGFPLAVKVRVTRTHRHERRLSHNVAAVLPGSDPALRGEHVVITAHLDHNGVGTPVDGDAIYNGAMDNTAGIAAMLEAARALAERPVPPRRSVLFLAVTAEEKGLIGSQYFAAHPTVPLADVVANVNLDMPILTYDFTDVIVFGAEHSTLADTVKASLAASGIGVAPDPFPEQAIFVRSDHFRFVQQGVPAVMLATGSGSSEGEGKGLEATLDFITHHYHRPSDDLSRPIDYAAGAKFAKVNYLILEALANADARPRWNPGDFFGDRFTAGRPASVPQRSK